MYAAEYGDVDGGTANLNAGCPAQRSPSSSDTCRLRSLSGITPETIAGFAPLIAGVMPLKLRKRQVAMLLGERWAGHPTFKFAVPPSTSPHSAAYNPSCYWRGPAWPVFTWLLTWALSRTGEYDAAAALRTAALAQLADETFGEYYHPVTGAPLGSLHQSWTAAVALDWLLEE